MTPIVSAAEDGVKARQLSVVDVTCDANDVRVRVLGSGTYRDPVVENSQKHLKPPTICIHIW